MQTQGREQSAESGLHWLVLAGTVSPYLPRLWDQVAGLGCTVRLVSAPRRSHSSFGHETEGHTWRHGTEMQVAGGMAFLRVCSSLARLRPRQVVVLGHNRPLQLALAAWLRIAHGTRCIYMGDTNGLELTHSIAHSWLAYVKLRLKRVILRHLFHEALVLGWTNELAADQLGIQLLTQLPLYAIDFERLGAGGSSSRLEPGADRPCILCPARLVAQKNLEALVSAWRRHVETGGRGTLLLAGDGPLRERLQKLIPSDLRTRIRLLGAVPRAEMGPVLGAADALVLPSRAEPWGIAVIEALGLGRPVLATRHVGSAVSEVLRGSQAVLLCGPEEPALLAGIRGLVSGLEQLTRAADATSAEVRNRYDVVSVASSLHDLCGCRDALAYDAPTTAQSTPGAPPDSE